MNMKRQATLMIAVLFSVILDAGLALNYELGKSYHYNYETQFHISEGADSKLGDVGAHLATQADVAVVWQSNQDANDKLLKITLHGTKLFNVTQRADNENTFISQPPTLQVTSSHPVYAHWNSGKVTNLFASSADTTSSLNVKKGVASLFQVQSSDGQVTEVDAAGECTVRYSTQDGTITKMKDTASCHKSSTAEEFSHNRKIVGVTMQTDSMTKYELSADQSIIQSASSTENHMTFVNIRHDLSSLVRSFQSLTFVNSEDGAATLQGSSVEGAIATAGGEFISEDLENDPVEQQCAEECKSASDVAASVRDALSFESLAKMKSASAYLNVLEAFRGSSKETILKVLNDDANGDILPQLLDVAGAAQTQAAFDAALEILDFKNAELERTLERFLVVTAFNNHPSVETFNQLFDLLKNDGVANDNVKVTLALVLGRLINTNCATEERCKGVQEALNWFYDGLKSDNVETRSMCLQALKNVVLPASIDAVLDLLETEEDMSVVEVALEVLEKFEPVYITRKVNRVLNILFHQSHRPVSIVVQKHAVTTLLGKNPSEQDVVNVVLSIPHQTRLELAKYVITKVLQMSNNESPAGATVRTALRNQAVGNYYNFGQDGFSTAYRNTLADTLNAVVDYDINILFTGAGLLRQSNFDVYIHAGNESMLVLQVAGYSKGLEYFFGEEGGDGDAGAGLAVQLMDMQLRPLSFFSGTGDIMAMAWNLGSASGSSYPALQGIMLLHDHVQKISLQSGFDVDYTLHGSASVDLGGSLDFSLWDRQSTTVVYNSGAMAMKGSTKVVTPFLRTGVDFHAEASGVINFITDVQFSTLPPLFCLQMMQEPLRYRNHINVYEQLTRSENKFEVSEVRRTKVHDVSFKLMDENSPTCHQMFGAEEEEESSWW